MMQGSCQSIQIRAWVSVALVLLRGSIARRAQSGGLFALHVFRDIGACDSKIYQVSTAIFGPDNDIGGLDITVNHWWRLLCEIIKHIQYFGSTDQHLAFLEWLVEVLHLFFQVLAFHVFLYHEVARAFLEMVGDIWD